jgi:hypothetical protein
MGVERAETEHTQEHMVMAGTTKTNIMEGMETRDHGVVCTGRHHVGTPRGLVHRAPHKSGMVSGYEGTVTMAPNKQQMDTAPSTKHRTTAIHHPRQGRRRATQTRTNACHHSDPTASVYIYQRTDTHIHTSHSTYHATCSVCVVHRRRVPRLAKTCAEFDG